MPGTWTVLAMALVPLGDRFDPDDSCWSRPVSPWLPMKQEQPA
jgi:hypothetical protein